MSEVSLERISEIRNGVPTVEITVVATVNFPENIFKYKVSNTGVDEYHSVCSISDLSSLGETRSGGVQFYRKSAAVVEYSSITEALDGKEELVIEIQDLLNKYNSSVSGFVSTDSISLEAQ